MTHTPTLEIELMPAGADLLQKVPLFSKLSYEETQALAGVSHLEQKPAGHVIVEQDSLGSGLYIIRQGSARVRRHDRLTGETKDLATLGEGELFGEMSLIEDQMVSADVVAVTPIELLHVPRGAFDKLIGSNQPLAVKVYKSFCRALSDKLRKANERLASRGA